MERVVYVAVITVLLGCGKLYISVISDPVATTTPSLTHSLTDPVGLIVCFIIGQTLSGIISAGEIMYSQTSFIRTDWYPLKCVRIVKHAHY